MLDAAISLLSRSIGRLGQFFAEASAALGIEVEIGRIVRHEICGLALDLSQVIGLIMSSAGTYLNGKAAADLNALLDNYITLAADTVGDVFGVDTAAYFSGASVVMLTRGDDNVTLSDAAEIVAGLGGNDRVNLGGGNDKYIGSSGNETVFGGSDFSLRQVQGTGYHVKAAFLDLGDGDHGVSDRSEEHTTELQSH